VPTASATPEKPSRSGASADLGIGVGGRGDATHADQRHVAPGQLRQPCQDPCRFLEERTARQPAGLIARGADKAVAIERGVGGDDAIYAGGAGDVGDLRQLAVAKIRGDL